MKPLSIYLFMAVALGTLVFCCVSAKATDCMVGYWRLDEGDGEKAYDSVNDNDGTIYGASWTTGMVGQALNFDGTSNYVDLGNGTELTNLTPAGMAVEAWVYNARTLQSSGVDVRVVLAQRDDYNNGGGNGYGLQYGYVKGYDIDAYFVSIVFFGGLQGTTKGVEIQTDEWYHIVGVFENSIPTIYINGVSQEMANMPSGANPYTHSDSSVIIGRHGTWSPRKDYHEGIIDDVAIHNCALTAEEIVLHYENGLNGIGYEGLPDDIGPVTSNVIVNPNVAMIGGSLALTANVDDTTTGDSAIASAEYSLGAGAWTSMSAQDGTFDEASEDVTVSIAAPPDAGVYNLCVRGTDEVGNVGDSECIMLVAYDPEGGFVTGGGWIESSVDNDYLYMTVGGKANFGFVSKYKKGANVPTGQTEFVFQAADLNFHSRDYQWLLVNQNGTNAQFKGSGTINGTGDYKFMLWAGDGEPDTFRIKIWEEIAEVEFTYYDNGFDQAIGGGSIVIHMK